MALCALFTPPRGRAHRGRVCFVFSANVSPQRPVKKRRPLAPLSPVTESAQVYPLFMTMNDHCGVQKTVDSDDDTEPDDF